MQFLSYFLVSIISYLGLIVGILLIKIAPEEKKLLNKNFFLSRIIIMILTFTFIVFYYFGYWFYLLTLLVYFGFLIFVEYKMSDLLKKSMLNYNILGILFFLSYNNNNLFVIESALIFLYGLPTASLIYDKKQKNIVNILLYNIGFILTANILYVL